MTTVNAAQTCRTCGFADCPSLTEGLGCPRWTAEAGYRDTLTLLTYAQLCAALLASCDEYETRFARFTTAATSAAELAGTALAAESAAAMNGAWAECKAQNLMTRALTAEIRARRDRGDYA